MIGRRAFLRLAFAAVVASQLELPDWFGEAEDSFVSVEDQLDLMRQLMKEVFEDTIIQSITTESPFGLISDFAPAESQRMMTGTFDLSEAMRECHRPKRPITVFGVRKL